MVEPISTKSKRKIIFILCALIVISIGLVVAIILVVNNNQSWNDNPDVQEDVNSIEEIIEKYENKIESAKSDEEKAEIYLEEATDINEYFNPYAPGADINEMIEKGVVKIASDGTIISADDACDKIREAYFQALELNSEVDANKSNFYPCIVDTNTEGNS